MESQFARNNCAERSSAYRLLSPLVLLVAIAAFCGCNGTSDDRTGSGSTLQGEIVLRDAVGDTVRLAAAGTRRLVSMAPNLTEIIHALGAGEMLVGRSAFCNYPPEVASIPIVGDMQSINYERLVALTPDLVLMTVAGNTDAGYRKLKELGIRPFVLAASTVEGVINSIDTVGTLVNRREAARELVGRLRAGIDSIRRLGASTRPVRTFIVINRMPLMTVSKGFLSELLEAAGGENIAAGGGIAYPTYSREELLRQDPDVILVPSSDSAEVARLLESYPEWKSLRAVRTGRVFTVDPDIVLRPGPRLLSGCRRLYELLHS